MSSECSTEEERERLRKVLENKPLPLWRLFREALLSGGACRDIVEKHVMCKLNGTDLKFFYDVNSETRKLIKRSSRAGDLKEKFEVSEISSISTLEFAWEHKSLWPSRWSERSFCWKVAQTNKLELLKWIREEKKCEWDEETISIAARRGNLEMMKYCVANQCPIGERACACAAENGHLGCLKYLRGEAKAPWNSWTAMWAARNGHLHILEYLVERKYDKFSAWACENAAQYGHLDCLKYLHETAKAPWDDFAVENAHKKNHTECLQYLLENNCPLPPGWRYEDGTDKKESGAMSSGVTTRGQKRRRGARDVWSLIVNNDDICFKHILPRLNATDLKFLYQVNGETRKLIKRSSRADDLRKRFKVSEMSSILTLEFAWENKSLWSGYLYGETDFCSRVAETNKLELLKWAREEKKCEWDRWTTDAAAEQGNLEMVKYCVANECPIGERACVFAAFNGHLECLKYLREEAKAPWDSWTADWAARNGHLHILEYLVERKYDKYDECACRLAAKFGHLDCLKYLHETAKAPWDYLAVRYAHGNKHYGCLQYLLDNNCPSPYGWRYEGGVLRPW
ncbi:unnamed protein product [Bathycoccus prasinos]